VIEWRIFTHFVLALRGRCSHRTPRARHEALQTQRRTHKASIPTANFSHRYENYGA